MLTNQQISEIEKKTGWEYNVKKDGGDKKFVVANIRQAASQWNVGRFELVLLLQKSLKLALWVDGDRKKVSNDVRLKLNGWAPRGTKQVAPRATGKNDYGHAVDFILDILPSEVASKVNDVQRIVNEAQKKLHSVGVPVWP